MIPNNRDKIPTLAAVNGHRHLRAIAHEIPQLDLNAQILLLLGRYILRVHKLREQISGPHDTAYAQKLDFVWVIVCDVCLDSTHRPSEVTSIKIYILKNGRPSHFPPCESHLTVKEKLCFPNQLLPVGYTPKERLQSTDSETLGEAVFLQTKDDHKLEPSMEALLFLEMMEN